MNNYTFSSIQFGFLLHGHMFGFPSVCVDQVLPLPALLRYLKERVPMDGHAVPLRLPGLPVPALRLHPAEGGLLQLVPGHGFTRQNNHQRHRPLNFDGPALLPPPPPWSCPHPFLPTQLQDSLSSPALVTASFKVATKEKRPRPLQCLLRSTDRKRFSKAWIKVIANKRSLQCC